MAKELLYFLQDGVILGADTRATEVWRTEEFFKKMIGQLLKFQLASFSAKSLNFFLYCRIPLLQTKTAQRSIILHLICSKEAIIPYRILNFMNVGPPLALYDLWLWKWYINVL